MTKKSKRIIGWILLILVLTGNMIIYNQADKCRTKLRLATGNNVASTG